MNQVLADMMSGPTAGIGHCRPKFGVCLQLSEDGFVKCQVIRSVSIGRAVRKSC